MMNHATSLSFLLVILVVVSSSSIVAADNNEEGDDDVFIGTGPGRGPNELDWPATTALVCDGTLLAVADHTNHRIQLIDPVSRKFVKSVRGAGGSAKYADDDDNDVEDDTTAIVNPVGVAAFPSSSSSSSSCRILVSDTAHNQVKIIDVETDTVTHRFGSGKEAKNKDSLDSFTFPKGVAALRNGTLIAVADGVNSRVVIVDVASGKFIRLLRGPHLEYPWGIAVLQTRLVDQQHQDQIIAVTDRNRATVVTLDIEFNALGTEHGGPDELFRPIDIAVITRRSTKGKDLDELLVVCDSFNHRIRVLDWKQNKFLLTLGNGEGREVGQFDHPWGVAQLPPSLLELEASDTTGGVRIVVAERMNHRLQIVKLDL